jgi:hypothetical protein
MFAFVVRYRKERYVMSNRIGKSAPIMITGVMLSGLTVLEGREPHHIEQRQYEEPSKLTYEIANSTATANILAPTFWLDPLDWK